MATQNQLNAEYNKELNRLKRFMRQARKKGFAFPDTAIPKIPKKITAKSVSRLQKITSESLYKKATYTIPETGQVVSGLKGKEIIRKAKRPKALKTKTPKTKVKTARTPKISSAIEEQIAKETAQEKQSNVPSVKETKEIPERSYIVLSNFLTMFNRWTPMPTWSEWYAGHRCRYKDIGYNVIVSIIDQNGEDAVAKNLEGHSEDVSQIAEHLLHGSASDEELDEDINRIATILQGKPLSFEQSINATELSEQRGIRTAFAEDMNVDFIL